MKRGLMILFFAAVLAAFTPTVFCQEATSKDRETTRDQLSSVLEKVGPKINIDFRRTEKDPFSFKGYLKEGLTNAEAFEVLISVSEQQTIHFRIFPHYNGGYINIDKAKASTSLMRKLLEFSNHNFLYWGMDSSADVFAGYTFTLESGFPEAAVTVVLYSIKPLDPFVGELKPSIDGVSNPSH
jgi:hypothetical protein